MTQIHDSSPDQKDVGFLNYITSISTQHFRTAVNGGQQHPEMLQLECRGWFAAKGGFFPEEVLLLIHNTKPAKEDMKNYSMH